MKFKKETKEKIAVIYGSLVILGLTGLMAALAFKGYHNSSVDLDKVDVYEGIVTDRGIALKRGKKMSVNVFYFRMKGLDDLLASYNMDQNYSKLMSHINTGDFLKIYFKESKYSDFNLNVIQIEKNNEVILDKNEYETKETALIYIGTIGGLLMFGGFIWMIMKARSVFIYE
jgi:hypothetical protein